MGRTSHDALACIVRRRTTGGGHVTQRNAERVHYETSGIGPGPSGCRDGVRTGVERVITVMTSDASRTKRTFDSARDIERDFDCQKGLLCFNRL